MKVDNSQPQPLPLTHTHTSHIAHSHILTQNQEPNTRWIETDIMYDTVGAFEPGNHLEHLLGTTNSSSTDITQHNLIFLADQAQELLFIERCNCVISSKLAK